MFASKNIFNRVAILFFAICFISTTESAVAAKKMGKMLQGRSCDIQLASKNNSTSTAVFRARFDQKIKNLGRARITTSHGKVKSINRLSSGKKKSTFRIAVAGKAGKKLSFRISSSPVKVRKVQKSKKHKKKNSNKQPKRKVVYSYRCPTVGVRFAKTDDDQVKSDSTGSKSKESKDSESPSKTDSGVLPSSTAAEGFGSNTVGGSGRHLSTPSAAIIKVVNLNDSGTGSLRACTELSTPRTCLFEVSGMIKLKKELKISNPYITIAGSTAPSPGIALAGAPLNIQASNVYVHDIYIMPGDDTSGSTPSSRDGIRIGTSSKAISNVMVDHVSIHWALDEGLSIVPDGGDVSDVTISNTIIASGLDLSIHPDASNPSDLGHSKAVLIKGAGKINRLSFIKNVLAHNADRNIRIGSPISIEYVNNIVYNWGRGGGSGRLIELTNNVNAIHFMDIIGNRYLPGPDSFCPTSYEPERCYEGKNTDGIDSPEEQRKMSFMLSAGSGVVDKSRYFLRDNLGNTRNDGEDEWRVAHSNIAGTASVRASGRVSDSRATAVYGSKEAYEQTLANAGARTYDRSSFDQKIISDVRNKGGQIINCVAADGSKRCAKNAGGWPVMKVNTRTLKIPSSPFADSDNNGYTNLEDWIRTFR